MSRVLDPAPRAARPALALGVVALLAAVGCVGDGAAPPPGAADPDVGPELDVERGEVRVAGELPPFPWTAVARGIDQGLEVPPGGRWTVDVALELDLSLHEPRYGTFTDVIVAVLGELRYDDEGRYRSGSSTLALSSNLTTTGVPIERFDGWPWMATLHGRDGSPFEGSFRAPLPPGDGLAAVHRVEGSVVVELPDDIPAGHYQPYVLVLVQVDGVRTPVHLAEFSRDWNDNLTLPALPLVEVGAPATPRMPWTILGEYPFLGRVGTLPRELRGEVEVCSRSGFPSTLILPPYQYELRPGLPSLFPQSAIAPVDGGIEVVPTSLPGHELGDEGEVRCTIRGPGGAVDLGTRRIVGVDGAQVQLEGGAFAGELTTAGRYEIELRGWIEDPFGRRVEGGGVYDVEVAQPLTFSTSCKPGTSFLVGNTYPGKVNVLPGVPATMEVEVLYWPDSDPARLRRWVAAGEANRFGHFLPPEEQESLLFDEPGEYRSTIRAEYLDAAGGRWLGEQVSVGVVAPHEPVVRLHGTRSFPVNHRLDQALNGAVERFSGRPVALESVLPETPFLLQDPFAPYHVEDTLFIPSNASSETIIEPHVSMTVDDPQLFDELVEAYTVPSLPVPAWGQPQTAPWRYLDGMVEVSTDSFAYFDAALDDLDELPVLPVGEPGWHPSVHPERASVQAYVTMGIVRPGFPVITSAFQTETVGFYWLASPNRFGYHYNAGINGDLPGDIYRIQAGMVLQDRERGINHYDAYAASIAVHAADREDNAMAILEPGARSLTSVGGREQPLFLALDSHDAEVVGGVMGLGGMVFPAVEADALWTVTRPDGEVVEVRGRANRLGLVRGSPKVPMDLPGLYSIRATVEYEELTGDVIGTADGTFWHCAVPADAPPLLETELAPVTRVDPREGVRIPIRWPERLTDARLYVGVMMPGQVLDQIEVEPAGAGFEYGFVPLDVARRFPNVDVRNYGTGVWGLADTVVFQLFLEANDGGEPVFDALRLFLRQDKLYSERALQGSGGRGVGKGAGGGHPGGGHPGGGHPGG